MPTPETGSALKTQFTKIHTTHTFTCAHTRWPRSQNNLHTHTRWPRSQKTTHTHIRWPRSQKTPLTQDDLGVRKTHTLTHDDLGVRKTHTLTQDNLGVRKTHILTRAHTRWPRIQMKKTKNAQCCHSLLTSYLSLLPSVSLERNPLMFFFLWLFFVVVVGVVARSWHFFQHNYVTHFKSL